VKVIVVGAGLAGLTAAAELTRRGVQVIVLDARSRVGGRTHGIEVAPGSWADAGAAYLGKRHSSLRAMIDDLGLATTPTAMCGDSTFDLRKGVTRCAGRFPPLDAVALGEMFDLLDELTKMLHVDAPWLSPEAARLDSITVAQWADEHLKHPDARLFFPLFLGEMMAADPAAISVLHMAFYLCSGGGIRYLNAFEGGAQEERIVGGAHQLCEALSRRLGESVRLNDAVRAIHEGTESVTVYGETGTFESSAVVVALPPHLADAIEYHPALQARRASDRTKPGCVVKAHLVYPTPAWREHGLSGWSLSADGPLLSTVDDSPADGRVGILTGFITGSKAQRFSAMTVAEQRELVMAQANRLFPQLASPMTYFMTDWINEEYSRGCYAALFGPGDWMKNGPNLTRPHGRIHWAGTETSTEFFGLMEGAIRSGHRVASEVLAAY